MFAVLLFTTLLHSRKLSPLNSVGQYLTHEVTEWGFLVRSDVTRINKGPHHATVDVEKTSWAFISGKWERGQGLSIDVSISDPRHASLVARGVGDPVTT